jgi:hypothetical protein
VGGADCEVTCSAIAEATGRPERSPAGGTAYREVVASRHVATADALDGGPDAPSSQVGQGGGAADVFYQGDRVAGRDIGDDVTPAFTAGRLAGQRPGHLGGGGL